MDGQLFFVYLSTKKTKIISCLIVVGAHVQTMVNVVYLDFFVIPSNSLLEISSKNIYK